MSTRIVVSNRHARLVPTYSVWRKGMLGWHAEAQPKDKKKKVSKKKKKEKRHASKACKRKAVADVDSAGANAGDMPADYSQAEAVGEQLVGSLPAEAEVPAAKPAADLAAEPLAEASLPVADDGDAAPKQAEADALPTSTQARKMKRKLLKKKQEDECPATASNVEPAGDAQSAAVALGSSKKKSSQVWPCPGSALSLNNVQSSGM